MNLSVPLLRRCAVYLPVLLCVLLLPGITLSQQPDRDRAIADLEKQVADLQKKLDELKRTGTVKKRRPIVLADILAWKGIHGTALSPDGQWFAYRIGPAEGN